MSANKPSQKNAPHIVIFSSEFPEPNNPTKGTFVAELVKKLAKKCAVTVVSPQPRTLSVIPSKNKSGKEAFNCQTMFDCTVYYPRFSVIPYLSRNINGFSMALSCYSTLRDIHKQQPIDVLHIHSAYPEGVAGALLGNWLSLKTVVTALGSDVHTEMPKLGKRWQMLKAFFACDRVTAVSKDLCSRLAAEGLQPEWVPTGVCREKFSIGNEVSSRSLHGIDQDTPIILFVGRLHPIKSVGTLINATKLLSEKVEKFCVVIIGDGPDAVSIRQNSKALIDSKHIIMLGAQPHEKVAAWMRDSQVLCITSTMEGLPNVVLEALALSVPVVGSRVGGIPEVIKDGENGYLVDPLDDKGFADSLANALTKTWNRETITKSVEWADWNSITNQYISIYNNIT